MDQLSAEMVAEFPERGMQWVKDRFEAAVNETGEVRPRKADTVSFVCVCGWLRVESSAVGSSAGGISAAALYGTKARDLDLRRR